MTTIIQCKAEQRTCLGLEYSELVQSAKSPRQGKAPMARHNVAVVLSPVHRAGTVQDEEDRGGDEGGNADSLFFCSIGANRLF